MAEPVSRRSFIKWVLASGAEIGCPTPAGAAGEASGKPGAGRPSPALHSEDNSICHKVRDGESMPSPAPDQKVGVVIVGGGPSGLAAADELKGGDYLLLEKEDHLGGNSYSENWEGLK